MWKHYCNEESTMLSVGNGEACNWCGCKEVIEEPKEGDE
jgi:hypothetical protein